MHLTAIFCNVYLLECRVSCGPRDNTPLKLLGLITLLIHSSCLNHMQETMRCGLSKPILAGKYNANMLNHFLNG